MSNPWTISPLSCKIQHNTKMWEYAYASLRLSVEGAWPSLSPSVCQSLAVISGDRRIILNGIPYFITPMENALFRLSFSLITLLQFCRLCRPSFDNYDDYDCLIGKMYKEAFVTRYEVLTQIFLRGPNKTWVKLFGLLYGGSLEHGAWILTAQPWHVCAFNSCLLIHILDF